MILFFGAQPNKFYAVQTHKSLSAENISKLNWLFGDAQFLNKSTLADFFVGPRASMVTPWSTNAVEISQNMGIEGILRIEEFEKVDRHFSNFDKMLSQKYDGLDQDIFKVSKKPDPIIEVENIAAFNKKEGLSLNSEEVKYLNDLSQRLERKLTEVGS